ncbi:hypothetical protein LXL04_039709 [Taraxacum kok-saghyz]
MQKIDRCQKVTCRELRCHELLLTRLKPRRRRMIVLRFGYASARTGISCNQSVPILMYTYYLDKPGRTFGSKLRTKVKKMEDINVLKIKNEAYEQKDLMIEGRIILCLTSLITNLRVWLVI